PYRRPPTEREDTMTWGARAVGAAALLTVLAALGRAADEEFRPEPGFTSLFNGKDLTGWTYKGHKGSLDGKTESPDGRVAVEGGVIVMRAKDKDGKGGIKVLETAQKFPKPFHLRLEFRASLRSDSGVYLRGPQLQVRDFIRRKEHLHLKGFKNDDWT